MKQQDKIENIIDNNSSIFARDKYDIGNVKDYEALPFNKRFNGKNKKL